MRAIVYSEYGSPDVLRLEDVEQPQPRETEVLIRIRATSVNDWDWALVRGEWTNRLLNGLTRPSKHRILGGDVAGIVEVVGSSVTAFQPGDEVYGDLCMAGFGTFAEFVCAPANCLIRKPAAMTFEQAAAIPQAGMLAVQGLIDVGGIESGKTVLLNGAGGGVGTYALQLAKTYGVEVTCVDSAGKLGMLRELGADHVIDYREQDFTRNGQRYDLILDPKTTRSPFDYARALNPGGTYATVGGQNRRLLQVFLLGRLAASDGRRIRVVGLKPNKDLGYINQQFEAGNLTSVIDGPYKLEDVRTAMVHFASGEHLGKIVITLD
jgi:NADPH:quinone reductase-like Zn-dependent oxidoreductase